MKCPICSNSVTSTGEYKADSKVFNEKTIFGCSICQINFGDLKQADLDEYYEVSFDADFHGRSIGIPPPDEYFKDEKRQIKPHRAQLHARLAKRFLSTENADELNVLDCGAGFGSALYNVKKSINGAKLWAYENSKICHEYLKFIDSTVLIGNPVTALQDKDLLFDTVIMSHFVEHLSPYFFVDFFASLATRMASGSVLIIEVPNDNWYKFPERRYDSEPHTLFLSDVGLRSVIEQHFDVKMLRAYLHTLKKPNILMRFLLRVRNKISGVPHFSKGECLLLVAQKP
jgi:hypothetical protein